MTLLPINFQLIFFLDGVIQTIFYRQFSSATITQNTQTQTTHPTNLLLFLLLWSLKEWKSIDLVVVHNSLYPGGREKYTDLLETWISGRDSQTVVSGNYFLKNSDVFHFGPLHSSLKQKKSFHVCAINHIGKKTGGR